MPISQDINLPDVQPKETSLTLNSWKKGVISLLDKSKLPKDALEVAENLFLVEDGQPAIRPGVGWYGADAGAVIDGMDTFDTGTAVHIVVAAGGTIYRSTNNGDTWGTCTGGTYTAGTRVHFNQHGSELYITTGLDNILRYDGNLALVTYTTLTTPGVTGGAAETGLSGTGFTYYYRYAAVNPIGYSAASTTFSTTATAKVSRAGWVSGTDFITLTLDTFQGTQTRADVYISEDDINFKYLGSTASTTYVDDGTAIPVSNTSLPISNTTQGPLVQEFTNIGSRMYGVRDQTTKSRIWFSSATTQGAFSTAYDGGYLDWQPGGKLTPQKVVDYRDGKGTPFATVFMNSSDGEGGVLQMSLDTLTIDDISVTIPSAYLLPGSRGTPAPNSVVNVLNDYMFYNSQAFYNLGSRSQFLNLLSTDEVSANIRPTIKKIRNSAEGEIASIYFDAKVYFSVPYGSDTNSHTAIYDTERKAWLPKAFTLGFSKFLRYTDTNGTQRLLAYKDGDSQLSEISSAIQGDYGVPFGTLLLTGLYPTTKNRFGFQWTEEGEIELSNPQGTINISLIGTERTAGFSTIGNPTINPTLTDTGWDSFAWDTTPWDDTSEAVELFSESSIKRYFNVNKELNSVQWQITTDTLDAKYILRTLQTHGTDTDGGKPRSWRLS